MVFFTPAQGPIEWGPAVEASRTGLSFSPARSIDQAGPLSFEGLARAFAPASLPRFPVTAGNRWGTATRPLDSARVSRRLSQRWTEAQLERSPSLPQGWP